MFEETFSKLPVQPPRPATALPGLKLRGAIPRTVIILPLFFALFFVGVPLSIISADPAARLAMGPSESAQGRVLSNSSASACRGEASHHVTYAFAAGSGSEYRGAATLCQESPYYSVQEGDSISVRYLKSDPAVNELPRQGANQAPPFALFLMMPLFFLAIFGSVFWPQIGEILRARRLYKNGALARGKVVFVKKRLTSFWPGMPGSSAAEVYIEIETPGGERPETVASCRNDWLVSQLVPGATVHVAYSPDKPGKAALLDAYWR
jgi:Protein of unknown function (DUF3592)